MMTVTPFQMPAHVGAPQIFTGHYHAGPQLFAPHSALPAAGGQWMLAPHPTAVAPFVQHSAAGVYQVSQQQMKMMPAAQAMAAPADSWTDCGFRASLRPSPSAAPPNSFIADGPFATAGTSQDVTCYKTLPTSQSIVGQTCATVTTLGSARSTSTCASTPPLPHAALHGHMLPMTPPMPVGKQQESERMETLPDGIAKADPLTEGIQLVSLGCYCGPKLSFKKMGRGSETLPFDWMRTRIDGLLDFMRNDFNGFFDFCSQEPVPNSHMVVFRNYNHSFWHDDPTDPQMKEKYLRRFERFQSLDAASKPVLFVRVIATTDEIPRLAELMTELQIRFGRQACLLAIVSMQQSVSGAALVDGCPDLMLHYLPANAYGTAAASNEATYGRAVEDALNWIVNREVSVMQFSTLREAHAVADPSNVGDEAFGLKAFEGPAVASYR
mmetsp:Transcript_55030/g.128735  ORF Transcript_55030/g.128735 Transcript_55030/m.128735 type:complete len:439 (-) Transcript_55030:293-1609(-)